MDYDMGKTKVICDTNLWYRLGEKGLIDTIGALKDCDLYITNLTIVELISSQQIYSNFDLIKHVFYAISKYSKCCLSQNDAQQILLANNSNYTDHLYQAQKESIKNIIQDFCEADTKDKLSYTDYDDIINGRKQAVVDWVQSMETLVKWLRNQDKAHHSICFDSFVENCFIRQHINSYLERNNPDYQLNNFNTNKLVFFKETLKIYLNSFLLSKNKKVHENDYIDYMNLLYCIDDFKYLTCDSNLNRYLSSNYLLPNNDEVVELLCKSE